MLPSIVLHERMNGRQLLGSQLAQLDDRKVSDFGRELV